MFQIEPRRGGGAAFQASLGCTHHRGRCCWRPSVSPAKHLSGEKGSMACETCVLFLLSSVQHWDNFQSRSFGLPKLDCLSLHTQLSSENGYSPAEHGKILLSQGFELLKLHCHFFPSNSGELQEKWWYHLRDLCCVCPGGSITVML